MNSATPKERPILFNGDMVRAILDGRKTQTRRIMKPQPVKNGAFWEWAGAGWSLDHGPVPVIPGHSMSVKCPYGQPGDRLWGRETHAIVPRTAYAMSDGVDQILRPNDDHDAAVFREGWTRSPPGRWRPSIHMPRWASRITLEITDVRVERLQDIGEDGSYDEGTQAWLEHDKNLPTYSDGTPAKYNSMKKAFSAMWGSINGPGSWDANPWVWVVEFKRVVQ